MRVETRAILAKEAIGILRRCVSWVTIMSPNASRSYRGAIASLLALEGFINPPMSRFIYHVKPSLQLVCPLTGSHFFFAAARRGQPFQRLSFGPQ